MRDPPPFAHLLDRHAVAVRGVTYLGGMSARSGYAVIDLETTGFGGADRIIEIGIAFLSPALELEGTWETLVQPNRDVANSHIHKLTPTELRDAPTWEEVAPVLAKLLNGRVGVAHNVSFEQRFLTKEFRRVGIPTNVADAAWVDTRVLASHHLGRGKLSEALVVAGITNDLPHAALPDALATAQLLHELYTNWGARFTGMPLNFVVEPGSTKQPRLVSREQVQTGNDWLARVAQSLPSGGTNASSAYRELLRVALADRRLSAEEMVQLAQAAETEGLTAEDIAEIHEDFLRQVAIEAWMDGIITDAEKNDLLDLADQLDVRPVVVRELLAAPQTGSAENRIQLNPGDRIALTGSMELPRETWETRAAAYGLQTGGVSEETVLVVAANPDTRSGKARRAQELGIPIISEKHFASLLAGIEAPDLDEVESSTATVEVEQGRVQPSAAHTDAAPAQSQSVRFSWVPTALPGSTDSDLQNDEIASLWIKHYPTEHLRKISPVLAQDIVIDLSGSSANRAGALWADRFDPMLDATVEDLRDLPGVGVKRLERMVEAVILAAIDAEAQNFAAADDYISHFSDPYDAEPISEQESVLPVEEIDILRGWLALDGKRDLPEEMKRAVPNVEKRFAHGDAMDALFTYCAGELGAACGDDERKRAIVSSRYLGNSTLDEIGQVFGVSRERVRQLESQLKSDFNAPSTLSAAVAKKLADAVLPLSRYESMLESFPELAHPAEPFHGTFEQYFLMWNLWSTEGEWLLAPGFADSSRAAITGCADENNVARLADAVQALGVDKEQFIHWLPNLSGVLLLPDGEHLVIATNHQDRAVGVLSLKGEPMGTEEIIDALGIDVNPRSLSNQLAVDDRVSRVGFNLYALTAWDMEEFSSINSWIMHRIEASETGSVALDQLIADAPTFNVSESSVRAYAAGSDFEVVDGMVSLSSGSGEIIDDDPQDYRDLYWHDRAWELLLTVTSDHVRGSGFQVPRGVAGIYQVPVGGEVPVPSRLGEQFVRVNKLKQPSMSTIRRFLLELDAKEGDRVWLRYSPDEFDVRLAPPAVFNEEPADDTDAIDLPHLLDYMGFNPDLATDPTEALHVINAALGLEPDVARRRTVAMFRHRGQDQFADIVRGL